MATVLIAGGEGFAQQRAERVDSVAPSLRSFRSDAELQSYLKRIAELAVDARAREDSGWGALCGSQFKITHRSKSTWPSFPTASVVVRASVSDTAGKTVSGAILDIDDLWVQAATRENGEAILVIPSDKIPESHRFSMTVRGTSHNFRRGQFKAAPGDTVDITISICNNHIVLQQAVGATRGSRRARSDFGADEQAGVDAGDDARVFGRFLITLRRGRLFSFDLAPGGPSRGTLRLIGFVNLYGTASGNAVFRRFYKLMASGDRIVIVGYDVSARDVEVQLLRITRDGVVSRTSTHLLRVSCAYGRCDARLAGGRLVLFASSPLSATTVDSLSALPALRTAFPDSASTDFHILAASRDIFRFPNDSLVGSSPFLNSVTLCDVTSPAFSCEARVIIGPRKDGLFVSPTAAYIWAHGGDQPNVLRPNEGPVTLFRVPLSGDAPHAIRLGGGPFDELSLDENARDTLRIFASGDSHFGPRSKPEGGTREAAALFTLQLADFGDGTRDAPASTHRSLPLDQGIGVGSQFIGPWLFYSVGSGEYYRSSTVTSTLFAAPIKGGELRRIKLPYYIERIASLSPDAMVIGTAAPFALHFLRIDPASESPLTARFALANPSGEESETERFVSRTTGTGRDLLAIPGSGYRDDSTHWVRGSTSVVFVRATPRGFARIGSLSITPGIAETDSLEVQSGWADDWYGNARGIFVGDRIFALIGYELIEGRVIAGRIAERQRINFMPGVDQRGWH